MSTWRAWLLAISFTTYLGCGGGGGGGDPASPDASAVEAPDAGGQSDAAMPPDGRASATLCESYCSSVMANCTGADAQYTDMDQCLSLCEAAGWREGQAGDTDGNSLQCRVTHAGELAAADPSTNCPYAGPTGGGTCGSVCENYCFYSNTHCVDQHSYDDLSSCVSACEELMPEDAAGSTSDNNSLECRIRYAVEAAAGGDQEAACAAADVHGNDTCGSWCEVYCDLMEINCSDQPSAYEDRATCLDTCATFAADGEPGSDMGDTVQCRIYHAGLPAIRNPGDECSYAGEEPTNYCIEVVGPGL